MKAVINNGFYTNSSKDRFFKIEELEYVNSIDEVRKKIKDKVWTLIDFHTIFADKNFNLQKIEYTFAKGLVEKQNIPDDFKSMVLNTRLFDIEDIVEISSLEESRKYANDSNWDLITHYISNVNKNFDVVRTINVFGKFLKTDNRNKLWGN